MISISKSLIYVVVILLLLAGIAIGLIGPLIGKDGKTCIQVPLLEYTMEFWVTDPIIKRYETLVCGYSLSSTGEYPLYGKAPSWEQVVAILAKKEYQKTYDDNTRMRMALLGKGVTVDELDKLLSE